MTIASAGSMFQALLFDNLNSGYVYQGVNRSLAFMAPLTGISSEKNRLHKTRQKHGPIPTAEKMTRRRAKFGRRSGRIRLWKRKAIIVNSQRQHCLQFGDEWLINVIYLFFSARSPNHGRTIMPRTTVSPPTHGGPIARPPPPALGRTVRINVRP